MADQPDRLVQVEASEGSASSVPQADRTGPMEYEQATPAPAPRRPAANGMPSWTLSRVAIIRPGCSRAEIRATTSRMKRVRFSNEPPNRPGRVLAARSSLSR